MYIFTSFHEFVIRTNIWKIEVTIEFSRYSPLVRWADAGVHVFRADLLWRRLHYIAHRHMGRRVAAMWSWWQVVVVGVVVVAAAADEQPLASSRRSNWPAPRRLRPPDVQLHTLPNVILMWLILLKRWFDNAGMSYQRILHWLRLAMMYRRLHLG